jgi:hypothetical protein
MMIIAIEGVTARCRGAYTVLGQVWCRIQDYYPWACKFGEFLFFGRDLPLVSLGRAVHSIHITTE